MALKICQVKYGQDFSRYLLLSFRDMNIAWQICITFQQDFAKANPLYVQAGGFTSEAWLGLGGKALS